MFASDASQQRIAIRERAKSVAKMYIDRAAQLQLDWERARDSGADHSGTALAKTGVREEGLFSVAAAVRLQGAVTYDRECRSSGSSVHSLA